MFYDPTPPLSSSWSEWPGRINMPGHYEDEEWERSLGGQNRSYSNPRLRRFDFIDENPRVSRTNSRSEAEMSSEADESAESENSRPPRVHRIPIFVEERQSSQESTESPDVPDVDEARTEWEANCSNNTVPRFRRRNFGSEDDLQRSRSHTSAFQRPRRQSFEATEPQPIPRRRRPNVTTVRVNCDEDKPQSEPKNEQPVDPKNEQLSIIESVVKEVDKLKKQVESVTGNEAKHCCYLDEMLTRCMLKLDDVNTMGEEDIRLARKSAIRNVQFCIDLLESKLHPPVQKKVVKSPEATDKVIVLPYYNKKPEPPEMTSQPDTENQQNDSDKNIIVLPQTKRSKSPEKTVIVLPYHDNTQNKQGKVVDSNTSSEGQKLPEKTVIVLPYHETPKDDMEIGVIPLPYYETNDSNKEHENLCTKL